MSDSLWPHGLYSPNPGIEPRSPTLQADSLPFEPQGKPLENSKDCTKKLVELINELSKIAVKLYKINVQKSVALLYTNNELSEREIKTIISLTIESRRIGYLEQI